MIADPEGPSFIVRTVEHRRYSDGAFVTHDPLRTKLSADVQISRWVRPEPSAAPWRQRHHQNEQNLLTNSHTVQVKCAPPCRWTKSASTEKTRRGARPGADA